VNNIAMNKTPLNLLFFLLLANSLVGQKFTAEKLKGGINSEYDEISPVIDIQGKTLYFTRMGYPEFNKTLVEKGADLSETMEETSYRSYLQSVYTEIAEKSVYDPERSDFNQDIWIAKSVNDTFDQVSHPGYPLNNALPNSVCAITPSANELVVINKFSEEGGMSKGFSIVRRQADSTWSFPEPIEIEGFYNLGSEISMMISNDGAVMVLALQREDAYGESDLYVSFKKGERLWTEPKNLGYQINTVYRESTPFLSDDNKILFFASNRKGPESGMDLFMIERLDDTWQEWKRPRRFVKPINSSSDDSQPFFNAATGFLYFTSRREGSSDIFRAKISPPNPPGVLIKGRIFNAKTKKLISAKVLSGPQSSEYKNLYISDDGTFEVMVPKGVMFTLSANKFGFTGTEETVFYKRSNVYFKPKSLDLYINPDELVVGEKIELEKIYFAQSKALVLEKSFPALNQLADILKENKYLRIKISGHTDNQGDEQLLMQLSEDRAKAIKAYLVGKHSIDEARIETVGYGATKAVNDNSTDVLRKENRRVEVEIIEISEEGLKLNEEKEE
jgi:OmpA-OmpF porin, OOP family